jgi:mannitol/fructose-specific phosphotransferase system IIA component (Ntr-type)
MRKNGVRFHDLIASGNVVCGLKPNDNFGAITELSKRLVQNNAGLDLKKVTDAVIEREKLFPTVIAPGLAVPHARIEGLDGLLVAIGTSRDGINFNVPKNPPVKVIILVLTPKDNPGLHLKLLSAIAEDFSDSSLTEKLSLRESPADVIQALKDSHKKEIPEHLTAADVMRTDTITLSEADTLSKAIEILATKGIHDIPVIDEEKDIRGVISLEDILRLSLPEHILWMDDLSPILDFQPFAELLRNEKGTKITDFMRDDWTAVEDSIPAIQVAKIFLMKEARQILVTRKSKFVGTVSISEFIRKFFWE